MRGGETDEMWRVDRNPVVDKIKLGARVGGTNVHGNASMYLAIETINEGDQIFEAPEELVISQKVRNKWWAEKEEVF